MSTVIAAIDNSAAARPVLEVARAVAELVDAEVEAVHVADDEGRGTAAETAAALGVPCTVLHGDVTSDLVAAVEARPTAAVVVGARGLASRAPRGGHVTRDLVQRVRVGVVVVPPDAPARAVSRIVVAVEGDGESHAVRRLLRTLHLGGRPEIIALHVFEPDGLPMFGDEPVLETEAWADAFEQRVLRSARTSVQLEMRVGDAPRVVRETAEELAADLVVLAWHGSLAGGHGRLVRSLLEGSRVPLLLLPHAPTPAPAPTSTPSSEPA